VQLEIASMSGDTVRRDMVNQGSHRFAATWTVPSVNSFRYRFESADFWENSAILPDTGAYSFVIRGWSVTSGAPIASQEVRLNLYPVPANGWPVAEWEFSAPIPRNVTIAIYDVLGRLVAERTLFAQQHGFLSLRDVGGTDLSTGLYILRLTTERTRVIRKFVLLR
jgi:hypothetical protein